MRTLVLAIGLMLFGSAGPAVAQAPGDSTHTVQSGETLYGIAQEHGVSVQALQRWNDLDGTHLQAGQVLRVRPPSEANPTEGPRDTTETALPPPNVPDTTDPVSDSDAPEDTTQSSYGRHIVEAGETFVSLALRLGTTADTLSALNETRVDPLSPGTSIRLPRRFGPPAHVVEAGETLYSIAGQYGASVRSLRRVNDLDTTTLQPGQRLRLPMRTGTLNPPGTWTDPDTTGPASVYPDAFAGRLMASGRAYDPDAFVVSHRSLPFGSVVLVSVPNDDRHTFARVLDRSPAADDLLLDLSAAVAEQLGIAGGSSPTVALRTVWMAE